MIQPIKIANKIISEHHKPFIIAEMSGNHNQSIERALALVDAAAASGADAIKLQTYTADTMTIDCDAADFKITDPASPWFGSNLYELYKIAHTPWDWHAAIIERCNKLGITVFSTPFDESSVDFLEQFDLPCYKIASFENTDVKLLKKVAATKKPVIVSTGMASLADIELICKTLRENGCEHFVLLKCVSAYPADPADANLRTIPYLSELFSCHAGLSDHTLGTAVAVSSVSLGARVIEKHFTLSRGEGGVDASFSLEPSELKQLVQDTEQAWLSLGKPTFSRSAKEQSSLQFRRSVYFVDELAPGETITEKHIRIIRPGYGLEPVHFDDIVGRRVKTNVTAGTAVQMSLLD